VAWAGRRTLVNWTHGDYILGNVRLAGAGGPVTGIVDRGGARLGRPALIDEHLMALTAGRIVQRAELGAVVTPPLRAGGLSNRDVHAAHALSNAGCGQEERGEGLDECTAILPAWLHHIADLWRKCGTFRTHPIWWAADFAPVLRTVAAGPACGSGRDDTATVRR
jgi:hypothetical protein